MTTSKRPDDAMATLYGQKFNSKLFTHKTESTGKILKNGSQELILLKKEFDSDFSLFWSHFCIHIVSSLKKL